MSEGSYRTLYFLLAKGAGSHGPCSQVTCAVTVTELGSPQGRVDLAV